MKSTKQIRKDNNWTQKEFAEKLGVSIRTVQNWDQGKRKPGKRSLKDIEKLLNS